MFVIEEGSADLFNELRGELATLPYVVRTLPYSGQPFHRVARETGADAIVMLRSDPTAVTIWVNKLPPETESIRESPSIAAVRTVEFLRAALLPIEQQRQSEAEGSLTVQSPSPAISASLDVGNSPSGDEHKPSFNWHIDLGPTLAVAAGGFSPLGLLEGSWGLGWKERWILRVGAGASLLDSTVTDSGASARFRLMTAGVGVGHSIHFGAFAVTPGVGASLLVWSVEGSSDLPQTRSHQVRRTAGAALATLDVDVPLTPRWSLGAGARAGATFPRPAVFILDRRVATWGRLTADFHIGIRWWASPAY